MLTAIATLPEQVQSVGFEPVIRMNFDALDRIPMWVQPVGVTMPDYPVMLHKFWPDGRHALQFLEPRYQLSRSYIASMN